MHFQRHSKDWILPNSHWLSSLRVANCLQERASCAMQIEDLFRAVGPARCEGKSSSLISASSYVINQDQNGRGKLRSWICTIRENKVYPVSHKSQTKCVLIFPLTHFFHPSDLALCCSNSEDISCHSWHMMIPRCSELCYPVEQMGVYSKISTKFSKTEDEVMS